MIKLKSFLLENNVGGAWIDYAPSVDELYITDKISTFLDTLSTDDDGQEQFENYIIKFKGFSDEGGLNTSIEGKTINQLENEMLKTWYKEIKHDYPSEKISIKEAAWRGHVFYAIYILGGIGSLQ